ncbi:MAG: helix-turn-helix domain-containing protein [Acidobacteria bacterium]|nr:helix-turn-helix domain-containing protein [Acidobacteriota bacterium]
MQYIAYPPEASLLREIGTRIRTRRAAMGWTLREIADRSGVSVRFLTDLEAGKGNISVARLATVARALDVPLVSLFPSEDRKGAIVALVGLRGAGKSTVGRALSRALKVRFVELDALVEKQADLSLAELFSLHGEAYYKRLAYGALLKVLARDEPIVLATGGSVVTDPESWHLLKRRTHTVWLKASPEDLWKRVLKQGETRPMSNRTSAMAELRSMISQRMPLYSEAAQTIDTSAVRVTEAVELVAAALQQGPSRARGRGVADRDARPARARGAAARKAPRLVGRSA